MKYISGSGTQMVDRLQPALSNFIYLQSVFVLCPTYSFAIRVTERRNHPLALSKRGCLECITAGFGVPRTRDRCGPPVVQSDKGRKMARTVRIAVIPDPVPPRCWSHLTTMASGSIPPVYFWNFKNSTSC